MQLCDEETLEVFAVEGEERQDGASDDEEAVAMSTEQKGRRRVSDMIDNMGGDENVFLDNSGTPRRPSNRSTDLMSPDQGYSATPKSINWFLPDWMVKSTDFRDAGPVLIPSPVQILPSDRSGSTASMSVEQDADRYNMNHRNRGKCIVFNHEIFDTGFQERTGSRVDVLRINQSFQNLGFDVTVYENLDYTDIIEKLTQLSEEDHNESDCLCIFMLTHGLSKGMICAKDVVYHTDKIWKPFTADKCKSLAGKPKLFFFQACRGSDVDEGVTLTRSPILRTETDSVENSYKIPTHADFLIAHSSVKGFYSWRNPTEGTWFVQSLCEVLDEHAKTMDLLKMLTITARKIATTRTSYNDVNPSMHDLKQVPSVTSMLLRDVYFTPKE